MTLAACALDMDHEELDEDESIEMVEQEIINGIVTMQRPEIGQFFRRGSMCTATLITRRHAITAAHCLNSSDYQDTVVDPGDRFRLQTPSGAVHEWSILRYYSFGSHFTEKIWNGFSSDIAVMRLNGTVPTSLANPVALSNFRVKSSTDWSTRFGYGCTDRSTQAGAGTKRYFPFQGLVSNVLCAGDSGGPTMRGASENASPLWAIQSGYSWDLSAGGYFDVVADAAYHKKQIEALMISWDGEYEYDVDRYGGDYHFFATTSATTCRNACANDSRCRAWTLYNGSCALKDGVPNITPLAGATSGLSPNRAGGPELDWDRPGADYTSFSFTGADSVCSQACANDYRCQAYTAGPLVNGQRTCWLKDEMPNPVRKTGYRSGGKRGFEINFDRLGTVFHEFTYSTPSPEFCQSECAKRSECRSWAYRGPANNRSPRCWLQSNDGTRVTSTGFISGLKGQEFR